MHDNHNPKKKKQQIGIQKKKKKTADKTHHSTHTFCWVLRKNGCDSVRGVEMGSIHVLGTFHGVPRRFFLTSHLALESGQAIAIDLTRLK